LARDKTLGCRSPRAGRTHGHFQFSPRRRAGP
jgi:hypothetical protein